MSSTRSTRWAMRSYGVVELRRTIPMTRYPFSRRSSARYDPSWPVTPVIRAVGIAVDAIGLAHEKREPTTAPSLLRRRKADRSRHPFAARCALHLARTQTL